MKHTADYSAPQQTPERATKAGHDPDAVEDCNEAVEANAPFPTPDGTIIARDGDTEYLLNGLIAECHCIMRELALPTAAKTLQADQRMRFITAAMNLAQTGASVGKAVAKLRTAHLPQATKASAEKSART
jgi:hypothetical protein